MLRDNIMKLGISLVLAKAKKYLVAVGVGLRKSQAAVQKLEKLISEPQFAQAMMLWKLNGKELVVRGAFQY